MTTPSSGVRPIDVETDLPARTAVTEQPLPRWATTRSRSVDVLAQQLGRAPDRPFDRQAVKSEATDAPLLVPAPRQRVDVRLGAERRVEGRVEDGHRGKVGQHARVRARIVSSATALCSGARSARPSRAAQGRVVDQRRFSKPLTTVNNAVAAADQPRPIHTLPPKIVERGTHRGSPVGDACRVRPPVDLGRGYRCAAAVSIDDARLERARARVE